MHIVECYALSCGLKIDKPYIPQEEIDLPSGKYITFHPDCAKGNTRSYIYWEKVLEKVSDLGYEIVRVGTDEPQQDFEGINIEYFHSLNTRQLTYLIGNASLHLGYDSLPVHIASALGKKIVCVYSVYSSHSYPFWSKKEDIRLHEPDWSEHRPSFNYFEQNPIINTIDHNEVSSSVIELLTEGGEEDSTVS